MGVHVYSNWNKRESDVRQQIEPFRKYFFICEGANTETFYFRRLIDIRKELGIHPLIDLRLLEKTGKERNLSYAKSLASFAFRQKKEKGNAFDEERDRLIIVFDADVFEEKVKGYEDLLKEIEKEAIPAVSNPSFELFLLLHLEGSYERHIRGKEASFLAKDSQGAYSHAFNLLRDLTGMNSKKNRRIGELADKVRVAIAQEKRINQDVHRCKGRVTSNLGSIIESIMEERL